jgi:hypothetical protein
MFTPSLDTRDFHRTVAAQLRSLETTEIALPYSTQPAHPKRRKWAQVKSAEN